MPNLNAGELAELYLARHSGFEKRLCYGDLFRAIRLANGRPLPQGTALQQRINDRIRRSERRGEEPVIRTWYEDEHGAVKTAYYWMTHDDAKRVLAAHEERLRARAAKESQAA